MSASKKTTSQGAKGARKPAAAPAADEAAQDDEDLDDIAEDEAVDPHPMPRGWRHGPTWLYIVYLAVSLACIIASFVLAADALYTARHPGELLNCDVNAKVSCSTVASSWQAEIIHIGKLSFPNAFFGICAESVFITIGVLGLSRMVFPRWFTIAHWWGNLAALAYAYWLLSQSLFVIHALCPWCILLMFSTTIQFMALSHADVTCQGEPQHPKRLATYYRLGIDLLVDVVWIIAIVAVILIVDGPAIFA